MVTITTPGGPCPVQSQKFIRGGGKCRYFSSVCEGRWSQGTRRPIGESKLQTRTGLSPGLGDRPHCKKRSVSSTPAAGAANVTSETIQLTEVLRETPVLNS